MAVGRAPRCARPRPHGPGGGGSGGSSTCPERTSSMCASWISGSADEVAVGPDEDPLGPDLDVDPRVVPVEQAAHELRRVHLLRRRQLLRRLAQVALAVRVEVAVVDLGDALDEDGDAAVDPRPGRVGEQQRDLRVAGRVVGLLRVAEAGGDVDRRPAGLVVGRHRPGDRLPAGVDRRVLGGDEAVEDVLDLLREARVTSMLGSG